MYSNYLFCCRNEYLMFQKITKLEYDFPDGFLPLARDLVEKLLVTCIIIFYFINILFKLDNVLAIAMIYYGKK